MKYPPIDVWRMSASRPWQLEKTSPILSKFLKYSGELRYHLIESVLVEDLSNECIKHAEKMGYTTHKIYPARGQGYAMNYALKNVITSEYALKWEDDFMPEMDIPLDICVDLMNKYNHINQICFNKRETMGGKIYYNNEGEKAIWPKEQRYFELDGEQIPLVVKEKWWFGTAVWRISYIKPKFKYWRIDTHNKMNDEVLLPLAGYKIHMENGKEIKTIPTVKDVEEKIGCYIYGKTGDSRMVVHTGINDSIWNKELKKRWKCEGKRIVGY